MSNLNWLVLVLGGASGIGKSTVARQLGRRLGIPWLQVDDLRLALERSGIAVPDSSTVSTFSAPDGLVDVGELVSPAIEVVIENHVDQRDPMVLEGDGILPSLFDRRSIRERMIDGRVRAIFLIEPDRDAIYNNMIARKRHSSTLDIQAHAYKNWLFSEWLRQEAERRGLMTLPAQPWENLEDRILNTIR